MNDLNNIVCVSQQLKISALKQGVIRNWHRDFKRKHILFEQENMEEIEGVLAIARPHMHRKHV